MAIDTTTFPADQAWEPQHVAQYLGICERHLRNVRNDDETFPRPRMLGRLPRWEPDVIRRWVAQGGSAEPAAKPVAAPKRKGSARV
jgi:predicted DNA-binding transcriptional regulator AlpA